VNKVFKVIYNRTLQRYQVVSELAKNHSKSGSVSVGTPRRILAGAIIAFLCGGVGNVYADPGSGAYSYQWGLNASATGDHAIALGPNSKASGYTALAFGNNAQSSATDSVAIGQDTKASGEHSYALGWGANSSARLSMAIGSNSEATHQEATAIGAQAKAYGDYSFAMGWGAKANGNYATALGANSTSNSIGSFSLGYSAVSTGNYSYAIGWGAKTDAQASYAIGVNSIASKDHAIAIGLSAHSDGAEAIAMGWGANTKADTSYAIGKNATTTHSGDIAFGNDAKINAAAGADNISIGTSSKINKGTYNIALGYNAEVTTDQGQGVAIGTNTQALQDGAVALGANSVANRAATDPLSVNASKIYKGTDATVATTFGANNAGAISVGNDGANGQPKVLRQITNLAAGATDSDAVNVAQLKAVANDERRLIANPAAGSGGKYKPNNGEVSLTVAKADGSDPTQVVLTDIASKTQQDANTTNITQLDTTVKKGLNFKGDDTTVINKKLGEQLDIKGGASAVDLTEGNIGVVSDNGALTVKLNKNLNLGNDGSLTIDGKKYISSDGLNANNQKITNVANGENRTDAVNYGQLQDAVNGAAAKATTVKAKNANVTVTEGTSAVGGKEYTVGLGDKVTLGTDVAKQVTMDGTTGKITAGTGANAVEMDGANGVIKAGTGDNAVELDGKTGTIKAGDKVTINGKTGVIKSGKITVDGAAGKVQGLENKTWDPDNYTSGQAATEDQLKAVDQKITDNTDKLKKEGLNFVGNSGNAVHKDLGQTMSIEGDGQESDDQYSGENIKTITENGTLKIKMAKNLHVDGIGVGPAGANGQDAVSLNGKDGEGHIGLNGKDGSSADIHVKDGAPGVDGVDGITRIVYEDKKGKTNEVATTNDGMKFGGDFGDVSKMKLNSQVNVKGGASSEADLTEGNIGVVSDGQGNLNVKLNKNLSGLEKIEVKTVKADTVESKLIKTETVTAGNTTINTNGLTIQNGPQITKDNVSAGGNKITEVAPGAVTPNSTDAVNGSQLYNATKSISKLGDKINKVGAGAAALAALHPLDFDPDAKWDVAVGYGNYANANAAAIGAYYRPNEDTMLSVGASLGGGENMINAGVSVKLGAGNHVSTSKVAMAKEIKDMRKEIEGLKSALLDANAGRKIDTSKLQLFPDVPQNHWAYEYVSILKGNGVIEGYPDGSFGGDRPMTRYEFATMLYRAMLNGAVLPEKLLKEFSPELERFTVDTVHADKNGNPTVERVRVKKA